MSEIDDQITLIKAKHNAAQLAKVRAETTKESAEATEAAALAKLKAHFGVDNLPQSRDKLSELQKDLQARIAEIDGKLNNIEL